MRPSFGSFKWRNPASLGPFTLAVASRGHRHIRRPFPVRKELGIVGVRRTQTEALLLTAPLPDAHTRGSTRSVDLGAE